MEEGEDKINLSIYKAARTIKQKDNSLYNALRSIHEDSVFVGEISQLWPQLPLLANLRCGLWYSPKFYDTCYFKSTDGHCNNWSFNTSRLNLHVALLAGEKGGCVIVDSTRKGKRFPDSMSKTIPIWTCVLNRCINSYHKRMLQISSTMNSEEPRSDATPESTEDVSLNWDCSLHLPLWVSNTEKSSIECRIDEWTRELEASGADIASLAVSLKKPLRPLWISQKTVIWLNEVPDHDSWDFTPIILVSASTSASVSQYRTSSEFSWNYIPGAGDDEESWSRGLTPYLFWSNVYDLINLGPHMCNQKVADIVERDRVYRAYRGQDALQITVKLRKSLITNGHRSTEEKQVDSSITIDDNSKHDSCMIYWLGPTKVALGTTQLATISPEVDCILNCDKESLSMAASYSYLHLPIVVRMNTLLVS